MFSTTEVLGFGKIGLLAGRNFFLWWEGCFDQNDVSGSSFVCYECISLTCVFVR